MAGIDRDGSSSRSRSSAEPPGARQITGSSIIVQLPQLDGWTI
jgi:hypothetical protein